MSDLLTRADWTFPVPIAYGPDRARELGTICRGAGMSRPLVVTDRGSQDLPFIAEAIATLDDSGAEPGFFAEISPNPTAKDIAAGRRAFRAGGHDGVVAIGGGSGMDGGKAISLVAANQRELWQYDYDVEPAPAGPGDFVPLVCVPTTAGTGAETDSTAMITDTVAGTKRCVWHPAHKPRAAILDPVLTVGLPPSLTAWTGCDALVHAIEALSVKAWHPLCDGLALEAIRMIRRWLPTAVLDGENLEARGAMLVGSCLAGVSFLKGLGLVHAMSHMVGAVHDTHHGLTNAVLLPVVLEYNRYGLGDKTAVMCRAMELPEHDFETFHRATVALLDDLEIPRNLASLGVTEASVGELARKAHGDAARGTNPVPASVADIETLLLRAIRGAR